MVILIDGYNVIRQSDNLRRYERKSLEAGRQALIKKLVEYEKKKNHQITVVFDGGKATGLMKEETGKGKLILFTPASANEPMM